MEDNRKILEEGIEKYQKPQMEIIDLEGENTIITSCPVDTPASSY